MVLVHGSNTDQRIWADHADMLASRFRVLALTQRYFGAEPWPDEGRRFSIDAHAYDLAEFVIQLQLAPATLVGWSYGAAVCLSAATKHSELIERLILYEPATTSFVRDPVAAEKAAQARLAMTAEAKVEASREHLDTAVRLFMDGVNAQDGAFENLPSHVQAIMFDNARMLPLLFTAPAPQLTCEDLGRLKTAVVVAIGGESRTFYKIAADWTVDCAREARLVTVPGARHLLPVQDPRQFSQLVLGLLS
jgi:pimeloyl-ACP methyl ester carboxylesterase